MKRGNLLTLMLASGMAAAGIAGLSLARLTPPVQAAPIAKPPAATATPIGDLLSGKTFPLTVTEEQMENGYHLAALVDAQGKASLYATRGETTSAGGETYLVAYEVTLTDQKAGVPPQPKPGTAGKVIYIDLHAIQAMGGIIPIKPAAPVESIAPATP